MTFRHSPSAQAQSAIRDARNIPYWLDDPQSPPPDPPLTRALDTDLLVVGAGFTGLWTALLARQRDASRDIVLIDAGQPVHGASGRNGGFVHASLTHGFANGLDRWPEELADITAIGHANLSAIRDTVRRHGIDCDWRDAGELEIAYAPHQVPALRARPALAASYGETFTWLDQATLSARIHSPMFHGALFEPHGVSLVNPARLAWGLRTLALDAGIRFFGDTRVSAMHARGASVRVQTAHAGIRARAVALATNAHRPLLRAARRRIVPVYDYVLVTEPLSARQWQQIGWQGYEGLTGAGNRFHYARRTADGRVLWGGFDAVYQRRGAMGPQFEQDPAVFALLAEHFRQVFPQLHDVHFSHAWGGAIDTCTRFTPFWGTRHGGRVAYVSGFTGLGVGSSRFAASVLLDLLDGTPSRERELRMVRSRPLPFPPEPLRGAVVSRTQRSLAREDEEGGSRDLWLRLLDRIGVGFDS